MPLSKLTIFAKDTDANEVIKGYEYQKLRTLENWLRNKANKVDEIIFCEYEDDILQRDISAGKSKFTQIKLYGSKPFSFKSEEITKSLANFFMLFVKGEYSFDEVQFVFETNTAIAGKYGDNDAELLDEWFKNQDKLDGELLQKCAEKVKSILTDYVKEELPKAEKTDKSAAQFAKIEFDNLPSSVWEDFAKSIKWVFNNIAPDAAVETTISNIKALIQDLPFFVAESKVDNVFTTLYYEVSEKMFQNEPEDRCLTNSKIDSLLLDFGDETDKQYNLVFKAWENVKEIKHFNLSEFFEVLDSAKHCRQSGYLKEHTDFWLNLLHGYIQCGDTPDRFRQKAIYEFLWLKLRPQWLKEPIGTLKGQVDLIEKYFSEAKKFDDYETVEDTLNLLQIIRPSIAMDKCDVAIEKTEDWFEEIGSTISSKLNSIEDANQKCYWLELQAVYLSNPIHFKEGDLNPDNIFSAYEKIIDILPQAPLYNVTRLNNRLNQFIKLYIHLGDKDDLVDRFEELADRIMPFVTQKQGNHGTAKTYVERGWKYLQTNNPRHFGKAISYFHKAKDLWLQDETAEGYVLALLGISQLYSGIGMNLAAKYYALSAAWFSINNNPEKLAKRIASAFGLIVYCDFKQGSWFSALDSFRFYIRSRVEFDKSPLDHNDEMLTKTFFEIASILTLTPKISIQLGGFIEFQKQHMGLLYTDFLEPLVLQYEAQIEKSDLKVFVQNKLDASPINDIGETRIIEWKAFGSKWEISFPNNWLYNSLGEEFSAILQVLLVELSYSKIDLHFIKTTIEIEIVESEEWKGPEQLASNHAFKWRVFVKKVDVPDEDKIRMQMASLLTGMKYLLRDVSMLHDDKLFEIIDKLFKNEALAEKTMTVNLYQRIYRSLFTEKAFNESQRNIFSKDILPIELNEAKILEWNSKSSHLYSEAESLKAIEVRYKNSLKPIYLTIENLKNKKGYTEWLNDLREQGWLDWQIILAIYNHVCSYKANRLNSGKVLPSDELIREAYQKAFDEIRKTDERENFIDFPLDYFNGPEFRFQLEQTSFIVLGTWGLQNRASFPNFPAIRDFLNHRFNFGIDDIPELSPLK